MGVRTAHVRLGEARATARKRQSSASSAARPSIRALLRLRDFRLLWAGQGISVLGDQFYLIALPWLVLRLTGDPLAVGAVLALAGVPRAHFIFVGGALTDRLSARTLMLFSNVARGGLVLCLGILVLTGLVHPWMLFIFAFAFGLADAFFYPAQTAIVPQVVGGGGLQLANAVVQGTSQLAVFVGPVLAGTLIALLDGVGVDPGAGSAAGAAAGQADGLAGGVMGIGAALVLDALSFGVSTLTLRAIGPAPSAKDNRGDEGDPAIGILSSIRAGLAAVWADPPVRNTLLVVCGINLLLTGPFAVGIPVLAQQRLAGGALAYGAILSAHGAGCLLGLVLGGLLPRPTPVQMWRRFVGVGFVLATGLVLLGLCVSTAMAAVVVFPMGVGTGYVIIVYITWLQKRSRPELLGRIMSLLMFAVVGLGPLSTAAAGMLTTFGVRWLFLGAGVGMAGLAWMSFVNPAIRYMGEGPATRPAAERAGQAASARVAVEA